MKPRTKGQLPPGLQSLASLPFALCSIGVASVAALTDMGPAKFHEKCLDKDFPPRNGRLWYLLAVQIGPSTEVHHYVARSLKFIQRGFHVLLSLHS